MAKKLFVTLQAPFVELPVESKEDSTGIKAKIIIGFKQYDAKAAQTKLESFKDLDEAALEAKFKEEILYIKDAEVRVFDEDTMELLETIKIDDTRQATSLESFWGDSKECLAVLLDYYFASFPWKGSIIDTFIKSLYNISFKEEQTKN